MRYNHVIVHYGEIGVKGKNRDFFEVKLAENIKSVLGTSFSKVWRLMGRIDCELVEDYDYDLVCDRLSKVPGVVHFIFALKSDFSMDDIKNKTAKLLEGVEFSTFKVSTRRSNKSFNKKSSEINVEIGDFIYDNFGQKKVQMKNPDVTLYVDVCDKAIFVYSQKILGVGGLPVGTSGKVVSSLSGGIDSPVSSFLLAKRGCKNVFVHIFNNTIEGEKVLSKIYSLTEQLTKFQIHSKLYIVPFSEIQKAIIGIVPGKYRMIIYRRFMMRILNRVAKRDDAKAIVTGDSVGQVASQTLDNITCIYDAAKIPVLNPLIGMNKEEIVTIAKNIGTYEISIIPYPDCCSFMIPASPETNGSLDKINEIESLIENIDDLVNKSIELATIKIFEI
ncbi:tRNA 4-thiouridine(8) synthase ThiI [Candidatus Woesearchaeota archaeon]|nr:tRNA 4-thiouridine(8) synthase ThiI [Candidatus Woesearchaeota archaeon]